MRPTLAVFVVVIAVAACGSTPLPPSPAPPPAPPQPAERAEIPPPAHKPVFPEPPRADRRPHDVVAAAGTRSDPYYWIRDDKRQQPDVLAYLDDENAYTAAALAPATKLEDQLFDELKSRVQEDDSTVPTLDNGYWYYRRYEAGKQEPIYARKKGALTAPEEILLDGNALATGRDFYAVGDYAVSRDNKLLAWTDDTVGRNQFVLHVKDLTTGSTLDDTAANVAPPVVWANDNQTLFYVGKDGTTLREDRVYRHALHSVADQLVFHEGDGSYYVSIFPTKSRRYIEILMSATTNTEVRLIDADKPAADPRVFLAREKDHLYAVDHLDGRFVIRTNSSAKNYRLVEVADGKEGNRAAWKDVLATKDDTFIEDFGLFHGFLVATVRNGGLSKVEVLPNGGKGKPYFLDAPDPTYAMAAVDVPDASATKVRFTYDSPVLPTSIYEADVATKKRTLLKQQPVPGYDPSKYASEYVHATAKDGTQIPISLVYRKDTKRDGTAPLLIYGYGSYGISSDPDFSSTNVSLLDRGWVYAIAHVRGGQEMGRAWYDDGHLVHKMNTFTDFTDATEYLVAQKYGAKDQVFAQGASAGGLLMGAILNLRPDLYRGVAAIVPFVDVVTTMLDDSIPLTTNEYDEWGNPHDAGSYNYMLSYSPYDNVKAQAYPSIFVHTGLWDSQVQYYEPTKWVAKLRATKTDGNLLLLDIDMKSGHGGASGRFDRLRQRARVLAFFLFIQDRPDKRTK